MNIDIWIQVGALITTTIILLLFIPKEKKREAQLVFLFKLLITWFIGLFVVELRLIEYPIRFFPYATRSSFTFEYFVYPAICAVFNIRYPVGKGWFRGFLHYSLFCSIMTGIEVLCLYYTDIIVYLHWTWYVTWITLFLTFFISRKYYLWFFSYNKYKEGESLIDRLMR